MDKHFLPEWLEKYSVFGLEMKLAWRRFKRGRITRYLVVIESDALPVRLLKELLIVCAVSVILLTAICLIEFPEGIMNSLQHNSGYGMWLDWLILLMWLFFVCVPAIQGSDCFNSNDDYAIFKQVACTGINGQRIASELIASACVKSAGVFVALVLVFIFSYVVENHLYPIGNSGMRMTVPFFLALMILQVHIYITSSVFGATRLGIINKRFVVLGFWLLTVVVPVVLGYWLTAIHGNKFAGYDYEFEQNVFSFLAAIFPLGSLLTYPAWAYGQNMYAEAVQSYEMLTYGTATVSLQVLYSYLAYKLACKLFARRLSE